MPFDYLDRVEATSKLNEKVAILTEARSAYPVLDALIERCFNYKRLYYIKALPEGVATPPQERYHFGDQVDAFLALLDEAEKTGRTDATKQKIADWLASQAEGEAKWYRRILLRDLKCGVSQELAQKAGFEFPTFEVMLATDGKKCKKLMQMVAAGVYETPKFDGYRCFAIMRDGECTLWSRNGTKFENFPMIEDAMERLFGWAGDRCYDGEIMSDDFTSMQKSAFASKRKTVVGDVAYHMFGSVPIEEWDSQDFKTTYEENRAKLHEVFRASNILPTDPLRLIVSNPIPKDATKEDLLALEAKYIEMGYEGAILNPADLPYYMGKSANKMLKLKTFESMDCVIVGANPGEIGGKREGVLGSFTVEQENKVLCDVGSGFKDDELPDLWERRDEMMRRVMEVAYQNLTDDGVMRFPIFKRWRPDKE